VLESPTLRTTRRRVLATTAATGSVALVGVGCDVVEPSGDPGTTGPGRSSGSSAPTSDPTDDADERLVADVVDAIAETLAVVTGAGRGRRAVERGLTEVARVHRAHLAELSAGRAPSRGVRVAGDDQQAVARVRRAERVLQQRLADAAVDAASGGLAALLASMSAAVAQRLASGVLA
jgi:hypothetical protein